MVTVVTRPEGHKIIDQAIEATITETYTGEAVVTFPYHGLGTGDFVYITSDIDEYNGFWYVTAVDVNTFKISEGATTDFVEYYQDADIEYYQTQEHDWSSIFLPIVYKCTNDRWPVNSVDSVVPIVLGADDNGFTELTLVGPLKANINALEFLKISGASTESANGVWQIVEIVLSNVIVINLPYELSGNLIGALAQYYYNNYQVKVKIYAGLPPAHPWYVRKPYEEVAELSLTPDDNNLVMFSVSNYIQIKVAIKNNLTLFSLPLNLDAFTGFYISTSESYDDSDSYSLSTTEAEFADDSFEGYAIAGKLPFKNIYAGDYADYVYTSGSPALWLTNRARLLAVEGYYFDVSFIKNTEGAFQLSINKYITSDYYLTETTDYEDQGIGVYRIPLTIDANYESFCVTILAAPEGIPLDNSDFANLAGAGPDWTPGAFPTVTIPGTVFPGITSDILWVDYPFSAGVTYTITVNYTKVVNVPASNPRVIRIVLMDVAFTVLQTESGSTPTSGELVIDPGPREFSGIFVADAAATKIGIQFVEGSNVTYTINSVSVSLELLSITEEICIDILETCESIDQFTQESIRLLEDGGYRLLE